MMSLQTIEYESRRAARRSAKEGRGPLIIEPSDLDSLEQAVIGVPFLGDRTPKGFKKLSTHGMQLADYESYPYEELLVDTSGFGGEAEPALSHDRFIEAVHEIVTKHGAVGLSLSEMGQFQGHVRVMVPQGA